MEKSKADPGKNEEFGNPGSLPEAMIPKVCPVCRYFSSTSNIALNSHIDHCLSGESNAKKSGTKFSKPKVKVRKKRSILDIIVAAPVCMLEDLDYSTSKEKSTADAHPLPLDQLNLRDTTKQRQHQCKDLNISKLMQRSRVVVMHVFQKKQITMHILTHSNNHCSKGLHLIRSNPYIDGKKLI